jgi:hypothetical protein
MLARLKASATWPDVGPIEQCSSCGSEFLTSNLHLVITLLQQRGPDSALDIQGVKYAARFCAKCDPASRTHTASVRALR